MESAQIEYLWKAMELLPGNHQATHLLRCHLMSVCRSLDGAGDAQIPTKITQKSAMCQYCSNFWRNGIYSSKVVPERKRPKSIEKIISRYNKDPSSLRKFEVGLAKKYARRKNTFVITCGICHKETKLDIFKPERAVMHEEEHFVEEELTETKKKKKRWSKDPTAGLKIPPNFHCNEKLDGKHEKGTISSANEKRTESPSVTPMSSKRVKGTFETKTPVLNEEFMITKKNKKKKKSLDSHTDSPIVKNNCQPKFLKKSDYLSPKGALNKLIQSNKMGEMFSKASPSSESPLSKFLSSL